MKLNKKNKREKRQLHFYFASLKLSDVFENYFASAGSEVCVCMKASSNHNKKNIENRHKKEIQENKEERKNRLQNVVYCFQTICDCIFPVFLYTGIYVKRAYRFFVWHFFFLIQFCMIDFLRKPKQFWVSNWMLYNS